MTEEEAVDRIRGVFATGGIVEFKAVCGVGGEWREEGVEIGLVGAIGAESGVCTYLIEVNWGSCMSGQAKEAKHGNE